MSLLEFLHLGLNPYQGCEVLLSENGWEETASERVRQGDRHKFIRSEEVDELVVRYKGRTFGLLDLLLCATTLQAEPGPFPAEVPPLRGVPGARYYNIVATPRSGSDMLCSILETTKELSAPREFLNQVAVLLINQGAVDFSSWLRALARRLNERNITQFGLKFATDDIEAIIEGQTCEAIAEYWRFVSRGRLITLRRRDREAQAMSWLVGKKTGIFNRKSPLSDQERELLAKVRKSVQPEDVAMIRLQMEKWEKLFIAPLLGRGVDLFYEDLVGPEGAGELDRVYDYLGVTNRRYEPGTVRISSR